MADKDDSITDALLRREVFLQKFASHLVNEDLDGTIQSFSKKLPSLLSEFGDAEGLNKTERTVITRSVEIEMREQWGKMWIGITGQLDEMAINDADHVANIYDDILDVDLTVPKESILLGHINNAIMTVTSGSAKNPVTQAGVWTKFTRENTDAATKAVNGAIWDGYSNGLTNNQIAQQVRGKFNRRTKTFEGGILQGRTRAQGDALVRTGANHFANQARDRTYQANTDILEKRILFATMDSRTSDICIRRHLQEWDITDKSYPRLPFHWNERSVYVVKVKGLDPLDGDRPSVGGKLDKDGNLKRDVQLIPSDTTWDSFLRRQPRAFVEETLGKTRAKLFIDGKMDIKKFTDMTGKSITLKDLKAKPSLKSAFDKAGLSD